MGERAGKVFKSWGGLSGLAALALSPSRTICSFSELLHLRRFICVGFFQAAHSLTLMQHLTGGGTCEGGKQERKG